MMRVSSILGILIIISDDVYLLYLTKVSHPKIVG